MSAGLVFWFTGLSGAGKSTVAEGTRELIEADGASVLVLDGDDVRERLHRHLGFTEPEIKENNALIAELCRQFRAEHDVILVPIISPYEISRRNSRDRLSPGFFEIYFKAGVDVVAERDPKGLYAKARRGEIDNMIGFSPSAPYEEPKNPDLVLDTASLTPEDSIERLYAFTAAQLGGRTDG